MTDLSDGVLVARVLSGQREAFGTLVERHQDRMLAYVRYMGFDEADALDIVQDGFVRAFRHLGRCGDPDHFDGWLFTIVSNLCRTAGKRRKGRSMESLSGHASALVADRPLPDEEAEASSMRARVRGALARLPDDQRQALVLLYLQGLSVSEIESLTGASGSAIKMRLKRGREALGQVLAPLWGDGEGA